MFDRTGQIIEGAYMGQIAYKGVITGSRVMYGGQVRHYVDLLENIDVLGTERDSIVIKESDLFIQVGEVMEAEGETA